MVFGLAFVRVVIKRSTMLHWTEDCVSSYGLGSTIASNSADNGIPGTLDIATQGIPYDRDHDVAPKDINKGGSTALCVIVTCVQQAKLPPTSYIPGQLQMLTADCPGPWAQACQTQRIADARQCDYAAHHQAGHV